MLENESLNHLSILLQVRAVQKYQYFFRMKTWRIVGWGFGSCSFFKKYWPTIARKLQNYNSSANNWGFLENWTVFVSKKNVGIHRWPLTHYMYEYVVLFYFLVPAEWKTATCTDMGCMYSNVDHLSLLLFTSPLFLCLYMYVILRCAHVCAEVHVVWVICV